MRQISLSFLFVFLMVSVVTGQANRDFLIATQLIRSQDFERARILLEELVANDPANQAYLQQLTLCYKNLKAYDKGIELLKNPKARIKGNLVLENELATLYHFSGDTTRAFALWDDLLNRNIQNVMAYQMIANSMVDRKEFLRAAEIFKKGRIRFKNSYLFLNELANAYLQANEYGKAVEELITLLENNPARIDQVQRMFSRFNDESLLDEAILVLEESGLDGSFTDETIAQAKRELLLWLYLERGVDKRAIRWAENMERRYPQDYYVFNVAQNLVRKGSFELAEDALQFYMKRDQSFMRPLALDALADLYVKWGKHLEEQRLSVLGKADSLYQAAARYWEEILETFPDYQAKVPVELRLIDLYLEKLAEPVKARQQFQRLLSTGKDELLPDEIAFYKGRFELLEGNFRAARVFLTDANRLSKNALMLEKSRYYLALTDFYAGDFEFAKIQLKSVERQPTSFYANDALILRNRIRKGMEKDSVLPELEIFSKAVYAFSRNEYKASFDLLSSNFENLNQLQDEAALLIVDIYRKTEPEKAFEWISGYPQLESFEHLWFQKVSLAFVLFQKKKMDNSHVESQCKAFLNRYPNGFYAEPVREILQRIMQTSTL